MIRFRKALLALFATVALLPVARAAVDPDDLLPVEEAFALQARAVARDRIEFHWTIADGYYLYRHRIAVLPTGSDFKPNPLQLPDGDKQVDEFFGAVETYRGALTATLTEQGTHVRSEGAARAAGVAAKRPSGAAASGSDVVEFNVRFQGCADVGVCYPPHQQRVSVALPPVDTGADAATPPGAGDAASAPVFAPSADNPLARSLSGGASAVPGGDATGSGTDALPLPPEQAFGFEAIAASPTELLLRFTPAPGYYLYRDRSAVRVLAPDGLDVATPRWPAGSQHQDEHFGDVVVYFEQIEVPLPLRRTRTQAEALRLEVTFQGCQTDGICYPPMTRTVEVALPEAAREQIVSTAPAGSATSGDDARRDDAPLGFAWALLLALGGGLILNLMPCVLPVLSLKALSLAESGRSGGHAKASALWYTLGVLVTFAAVGGLVLGLRATGQALGWGFQLQQPLVIGALAYVMVALGLNLSGVYEVGGGLAGRGQALTERPGAAGDFFTGALAVVVASPCTAPFMGSALAFAFAAPFALAMGVFVALGLGLALPFLLIGFVPSLGRLLPRPGLWMDTFRQVLAFPLYLTAAWLLWVLGHQRGVDAIGLALVGLLALAAGLWWWGRQGLRHAPRARAFALLLMLLGGAALWGVHTLPAATAAAAANDDTSLRYSPEQLSELRAAGRVVFVNMTADWCVTCKANEKRVLAREAFATAMQRADAVYMKGDWTNVDPQITRFLEAHGAVGVPLYVVFGRDGSDGVVLPTVLTQAAVDDALARAAR